MSDSPRMTDQEKRVVALLADAWNALIDCVTDEQDRSAACVAIHQVQKIVLAQATIRSEPDFLRQRPAVNPADHR